MLQEFLDILSHRLEPLYGLDFGCQSFQPGNGSPELRLATRQQGVRLTAVFCSREQDGTFALCGGQE